MDPTASWQGILTAVKELQRNPHDPSIHEVERNVYDIDVECDICEARDDLIYDLRNLADWLEKGGFPSAA